MTLHLSHQIFPPEAQQAKHTDEHMWVNVIQKMDEVYIDLVKYQVELEQKNADLEEAQQFIQSVQDAMSDILIVCDLHGDIQQVNQALLHLTHRAKNEIIQTSLATLFVEKATTLLNSILSKIRAGKTVEKEILLCSLEQEPTLLMVRCSPQFSHKGVLIGMVFMGRTIGELRRAYNKLNQTHTTLQQTQHYLVQSEKMASLGRLVAGVAHELNNPISFVHSNMYSIKKYGLRLRQYIQALHTYPMDKSTARLREKLHIDRVLNDIPQLVDGGLEGTERARKIVQDLRRFSTATREEKKECDVLKTIKNAIHWTVQASSINIKVEIIGQPLLIFSYHDFIHQVMVNLVQNAVDAMETVTNPKLVVHCLQKQDTAQIMIQDNGTGICEDHLFKIFDPFFTTKEIGKGTGLGLYISYGLIIEQCQGKLEASNHPEGGAIFRITLPLNTTKQASAHA